MIFSGQEMMKSVKSNLNQKRSKTRYFDREVSSENITLDIDKAPKLSKKELAAFSENFKKNQRRWTLKVWGISLLVSGLIFLLVAFIVS